MTKPTELASIPFFDIVDQANDVIIVTKADTLDPPGPEIIYVNKAFTQLTGYSYEEAVGNTPRMLQGPDTDPKMLNKIKEGLKNQGSTRVDVLNYTKKGTPYWLDLSIVPLHSQDRELTFFAAIERNQTEHKNLQHQLEKLASTDSLTTLTNRRAFFEKTEYEFKRMQRSHLKSGLLMIDIDNFKQLNDQYGYQAGDYTLKKIAASLKSSTRDIDIVARYGGEEFIILLPLTDEENTLAIAKKLIDHIASLQLTFGDSNITSTISIGCTNCTSEDKDISACITRADKALYKAKSGGKNRAEYLFE